MSKKLASDSAVVHNGEQVDGVTSTGSTPSTTEANSVANVAHQSDCTVDPSAREWFDDGSPVIGAATPVIPRQRRYSYIYDQVLEHPGQWLPVTFERPARVRAFLNATYQARAADRASFARGEAATEGLSKLETKQRKLTVYLRVPDVPGGGW